MQKTIHEQKKLIKKRLNQKQDTLLATVGKMGDGLGNLYADATRLKVYIRFGESQAIPVFNNRVPAENDLQVIVGYAPEQYEKNGAKLYQVLSTYSDQPGGETGGILGSYAPAKRYEWLAPRGGQDPLYVHNRAITFLNIYVTAPNSMSVQLTRGVVWNGDIPIEVPYTTHDHTGDIPATTGKAVLVLHTIDGTGANIQTVSAEFDVDDLMPVGDRFVNMPALPAGTVWTRGLVRVYNGQEKIQEGRTNTDIIDLRFSGLVGGDDLLIVNQAGADMPERVRLQFIGPGVTITDDAGNERTIVTIMDTQLIGLARWNAVAGDDVFPLPDIAAGVLSMMVNGLPQDMLTYTLSSDGTQVTIDAPLPFDAVVSSSYLTAVL